MFSKFDFLAHRKIWFTFSGVMVLIAIISVIMFRFNWGIDFTGGTILELGFDKVIMRGKRAMTSSSVRETSPLMKHRP